MTTAVEAGAWSDADRQWMRLALDAARRASALGEVPVGAVLVQGTAPCAVAHNLRETAADPTAHAEMLAIRRAASDRGGWRLDGLTMYVTLEPCPMCAGALWLARIQRLVFAAADERAGAAGTLYNVVADPRLNHRLRVETGLFADESRDLLQGFFRRLRAAGRHGLVEEGGGATEGCPSG